MALEAICGLNKYNISYNANEGLSAEMLSLTRNFGNNIELALPPYANPAVNLGRLKDEQGNAIKIHFDHGTTTLGFIYQGGVVLAVDSRASGGSYIASQNMKKIVEINDFLLGTMAGSAADCVYWDRVLTTKCRMYELRNRERISVAAASKIMANQVYCYKGVGKESGMALSIGMMLAGWDKRGPGLYYVNNDGLRTQGTMFSVGSGSIYAYGVLDRGYSWDLEDDAAFELGRRAIYYATHRDAFSGGCVRVYHMTKDGWRDISNQDSKDLHYMYQEEKNVKA